jgi:hypothetical protein
LCTLNRSAPSSTYPDQQGLSKEQDGYNRNSVLATNQVVVRRCGQPFLKARITLIPQHRYKLLHARIALSYPRRFIDVLQVLLYKLVGLSYENMRDNLWRVIRSFEMASHR